MVVLLDLDDDPFLEPLQTDSYSHLKQPYHARQHPDGQGDHADDDGRPNPNINGFSAILSCYPIVSQLASLLDLNTLHNLSRTCRQFRANLLQYRNQLVTQTLRCSNEELPTAAQLAARMADAQHAWNGAARGLGERITSGRIGKCARDMVGECRSCGLVVCRNCASKPPVPVALPGRLRRLCKTCANAPLSLLTSPSITTPPPACGLLSYRSPSAAASPGNSPHSSTSTLSSTPPAASFPLFTPSSSPANTSSPPASHSESRPDAFTAPAFLRTPCTCPDTVWLCQSCGHSLRTTDQTYMLGWTWRTRYSTYLGGLGTGIGEGHEGVKCGLGSACRGGRDVEHEECGTADEIAELQRQLSSTPPLNSHGVSIGSGYASNSAAADGLAGGPHDEWSGTSFFAQEIEGIGGRRVMKVKKRVRVGAVVKEYEDEREGRGSYLGREKDGTNRSWCAWCARVVPSRRDARELKAQGHDGVLCGDGRSP